MNKNLQLFGLVFLISLPFWWGVNVLQENVEIFFYQQEIAKNPPFVQPLLLAANINTNIIPQIKCHLTDIKAESFFSVLVDATGTERVLFAQKENQKMPIASLTKLMTAAVASEFYTSEQMILISERAINQPENIGYLKIGEKLTVQDLVTIMLMESSNDAAFALTEPMGESAFVHLMNLKAADIGMVNSYFYNPTGVDPESVKQTASRINYSTAGDLVKLVNHLLDRYPDVFSFLNRKEYPLYLGDGTLHHILRNTNELAGEVEGMIAGKTGLTDRAGGCLLVILAGGKQGGYLVDVVLNSAERFEDMKRLIECSSTRL